MKNSGSLGPSFATTPLVLAVEVYPSMLIEPPSEFIPVNMLLTVKPLPLSSPALISSTPTPVLPEPARTAEEATLTIPPSATTIG